MCACPLAGAVLQDVSVVGIDGNNVWNWSWWLRLFFCWGYWGWGVCVCVWLKMCEDTWIAWMGLGLGFVTFSVTTTILLFNTGLVATSDLNKGQIIFSETPLVCVRKDIPSVWLPFSFFVHSCHPNLFSLHACLSACLCRIHCIPLCFFFTLSLLSFCSLHWSLLLTLVFLNPVLLFISSSAFSFRSRMCLSMPPLVFVFECLCEKVGWFGCQLSLVYWIHLLTY